MAKQVSYLQALYDSTQRREKATLAANTARENEIRGTFDQLIGQGQGAFRAAGEADIEEAKTIGVGLATQHQLKSGLYGLTTTSALPVQAENQAAKSRIKLEDLIQQRQTSLKLGKAAFVERISDPYPDYSMLMQAMAANQQTQQSQPVGSYESTTSKLATARRTNPFMQSLI